MIVLPGAKFLKTRHKCEIWAKIITMSSFPFGKAALWLLLLACASGAFLLATPPPKQTADLVMWTFAKPHYEAYLKARPAF